MQLAAQPRSSVDDELLGDNADVDLFSVDELGARLDEADRAVDDTEITAIVLSKMPPNIR